MNAGNGRSTRLAMSAGTNPMDTRAVASDSLFPPQYFTAPAVPNGSIVDYDNGPTSDLRSVVERRFKRMNEAHDRIRTELLAHPPHAD